MNRTAFFVSAVAGLCLAVGRLAAAEPPATTDLERLAGTWTVTAAEQGGKPFDVIRGGRLIITGEQFELHTASGNHLTGTLRLDESAIPKQIDFLLAGGAVWLGIYSTSGATFRLNYVEKEGGATRPAVFATTADTPGTVIMMRRPEGTP